MRSIKKEKNIAFFKVGWPCLLLKTELFSIDLEIFINIFLGRTIIPLNFDFRLQSSKCTAQ